MDPKVQAVLTTIKVAQAILGSGIVPELTTFLANKLGLTDEEKANLDLGLIELEAVKDKIEARRKELAGE